jgi:hypothetical protein
MKNLVALVIILLFAGASTWAYLKFFVWEQPSPQLAGVWEVQSGPLAGGSYEFLPEGSLIIRSNDGPDMKARVAVEGKTLLTTTQNPSTGKDETRKSTIKELTATSLVLEVETGGVLKMARKK